MSNQVTYYTTAPLTNKVVMVKSALKSIHSTKDGGHSLDRMVPSNSGLSWTKSPCSLLIVAKAPQLIFLGLRALDQNQLLAIKLDVVDQIVINLCRSQMLEIGFHAPNVKISQKLMTEEPFLNGALQLRFLGLRALDQNHLLAYNLTLLIKSPLTYAGVRCWR